MSNYSINKKDFEILKYSPNQALSILKPVAICMLLISSIVLLTNEGAFDNRLKDGNKLSFISQIKDTDTKAQFDLSKMAILAILGLILSTLVLFIIVYFNFIKLMGFILSFSIFFSLIFVSFLFWFAIATSINLTIDCVTIFFLIFNNAFLSYTSFMWKGPKLLTKFYHLYLSVLLSWFLHTMTTVVHGWLILIMASLWDLIAVIPKYGPLNMIIKILDRRGQTLPTALIYSTFFHWRYFSLIELNDTNQRNKNLNNNIEETNDQTDKKINSIIRNYFSNQKNSISEIEDSRVLEEEGPKLGIGDFVFYSLLIAKSTIEMNHFITFCCFLTILIGLLATIVLVAFYNRPLPALPISIFLSIFVFLIGQYSIIPFCNKLNMKQILI